MSRKVLGIDFGCSQSSIAIMDIGSTGSPTLIPVGGGTRITIPTLLAVEKNDDSFRACGYDVCTLFQENEIETVKFASNFKRYLGRESKDNTNDNEKNADKYCRLFLKQLAERVKKKFNVKELKSEDYVTCIAFPATWEKKQVELLKKYVEEAGFPSDPEKGIYTVEEPVAAMCFLDAARGSNFHYGDHPEYYMIIDFGGGTLDICIIKTDINGLDPQVVSKSGDSDLGGKDFDDIIEDLFFQQNESILKERLAHWEIEDLRAKIKEVKEAISKDFLNQDKSKQTIVFKGHQSLTTNKKDFIEICRKRGFLDKIKRSIHEAIDKAHIETSSVPMVIKKVILTGGSSKWFFLREIVADELGLSKDFVYNTKDPFTDVANGCAIKFARAGAQKNINGVWVKCKIGENGVWSQPKNVLNPTVMVEEDVVDIYLCTITQTRYFHPYQITISLWEGSDTKHLNLIDDIAVFNFYARSNLPFLKRPRKVWQALNDLEYKPVLDEYNVYLRRKKKENGEITYVLRFLNSSATAKENERLHNGKEEENTYEIGEVRFGMKSYCPMLGFRKRYYLPLERDE